MESPVSINEEFDRWWRDWLTSIADRQSALGASSGDGTTKPPTVGSEAETDFSLSVGSHPFWG